jgi:hypothetical protein
MPSLQLAAHLRVCYRSGRVSRPLVAALVVCYACAVSGQSWQAASFPSCPTPCGLGQSTQTRAVSCVDAQGAPAAASYCSSLGPAPVSSRTCAATAACPLTGLCDGPCVDNDAGARAAFGQDCAAVLAQQLQPNGHGCEDDPFNQGPLTGHCPLLCGACVVGSTLSAPAGILVHQTSAGYSAVASAYANSANCARTLQAPAGQRVRLRFASFDTVRDALDQGDGASTSTPLMWASPSTTPAPADGHRHPRVGLGAPRLYGVGVVPRPSLRGSSALAPAGMLVSCGVSGACAPRGNCRNPPPVQAASNRTVVVDFATGVQMPEIDYTFLFSKAMAGMTLPGPTILLYETDRIVFRMNDAEPWTLSAVCDGCLSQGR